MKTNDSKHWPCTFRHRFRIDLRGIWDLDKMHTFERIIPKQMWSAPYGEKSSCKTFYVNNRDLVSKTKMTTGRAEAYMVLLRGWDFSVLSGGRLGISVYFVLKRDWRRHFTACFSENVVEAILGFDFFFFTDYSWGLFFDNMPKKNIQIKLRPRSRLRRQTKRLGSWYVSGKLPTYPSPKPTFALTD